MRKLLLIVLLCGGCADATTPRERTGTERAGTRRVDAPERAVGAAPADRPGLPHVMWVSQRICSGGLPEGDEAFAGLAEMGIRTIVCVDGAQPNIAAAKKHGLRYVHIPIGYDGISQEAGAALARVVRAANALEALAYRAAGAALARVVRDVQGPIYVHCHHGKHRSPAAAAVACIADGGADQESALAILARAGTSKDYAGLWRDVKAYSPPRPGAALPELVEIAHVGSMTAAMVDAAHIMQRLDLCSKSGWKTPAKHPDLAPVQEAVLLKELFREAARNLAAGTDQTEEHRDLQAAEVIAEQMERALKARDREGASRQFARQKKSCKTCHVQHRD